MDLLSRIASWLGENEATISAVVGITVLAGVLFAGLRSLLRRRTETSQEKAPASNTETPAAADASAPDLDPLTVPGFEGRPALAVLPFDDLSSERDQEYFADGIAEDLITRLSAWRDFPVIARNSSFTYKGKPVDVKQVSRELGVRYVVEGSVRKAGERVSTSVQLIDATTGCAGQQGHLSPKASSLTGQRWAGGWEDRPAMQDPSTAAAAGALLRALAGGSCIGSVRSAKRWAFMQRVGIGGGDHRPGARRRFALGSVAQSCAAGERCR